MGHNTLINFKKKICMIGILRIIRQKLLIENKIRKYLFYALGEIFLIMVGILLATQIREWNQEKNDRVEERILLTRISGELNFNCRQLSL